VNGAVSGKKTLKEGKKLQVGCPYQWSTRVGEKKKALRRAKIVFFQNNGACKRASKESGEKRNKNRWDEEHQAKRGTRRQRRSQDWHGGRTGNRIESNNLKLKRRRRKEANTRSQGS